MVIKKNLIANYCGQGWNALMSYAFIPLYISYIGMEAYGLIGMFAILQSWLSLLDMGMTPVLSREMARAQAGGHTGQSIRNLLRSVETITLGAALLIVSSITLSSNWIATVWVKSDSLSSDSVAQAFTIMGIVTALRFVENIYRSAVLGQQRHVLFNVVNSSMATARGIGAVAILAWVSPTIEAFFIWQGAMSIITLFILGNAAYSSLPKSNRNAGFSLPALRGVWSFAGGSTSFMVLSLLLSQGDKILLSKLLDLKEFGYYALATTLAATIYIFIGPITQAFYPKFCELHTKDDKELLYNMYHKGSQMVSIVAGSVAALIFFYADIILLIWTQDSDLTHKLTMLLTILVIGNLMNGLMWIPHQMQLAHGWTGLMVKINIATVTVMAPALLCVVPIFGTGGAAWVWLILNIGYCIFAIHFMHKRIMQAEKWVWCFQDTLGPVTAAFILAGSFRYLMPEHESVIQSLTVLLSAAVVTFSASVLASSKIRRATLSFLASMTLSIRSKSL